jgi:RHH-type proline utilization regulon transcriptional repressor/proline dehydrogenase/delta 1-pyrroline-5-carboxylate dehydrogenase
MPRTGFASALSEEAFHSISAAAFMDETAAVKALLSALEGVATFSPAIRKQAEQYVTTIRNNGIGNGIEAFLHEYGLDSKEGVAVMCLAEALLRIPDAETANNLIEDKFSGTQWSSHLGKSESLFVNASTWGLMLTGKVVNLGRLREQKAETTLSQLVKKIGEPVVREALKKAMRIVGTQFVLGQDVAEALDRSKPLEKKGYSFSYDILGEGARTQEKAREYHEAYLQAIDIIGDKATKTGTGPQVPSISVKLSALHPRYELLNSERVMAELLPVVKEIVAKAKDRGISVSLDAEEASRFDVALQVYEALVMDEALKGFDGIGFVLQGYQKRAFYTIDWLVTLAKRAGKRLPVRLVKGAYWDAEIKWAQAQGLPSYPVFTRKEHTDLSYTACARKLLRHADVIYPQFATHNALTVATVQEFARELGATGKFEFQRLYGMGEKLYEQVDGSIPRRIYAPIGVHEDLLAYLIRRLLENGANSSFVNLVMDKSKALEELLMDPVTRIQKQGISMNPKVPLPVNLYGDHRQNSQGLELGNLQMMETLSQQMKPFMEKHWEAGVISTAVRSLGKPTRMAYEPANSKRAVGYITDAVPEDLEFVIAEAQKAQRSWNQLSFHTRAEVMEKAALLIEENLPEFIALCTREAGKTLSDGIAEVREAVDFCRYYAAEARNLPALGGTLRGPTGESNQLNFGGRGVFLCISPWNFPLAIFIGQVVAALVTGNSVIAKPAEQTPLVAALAVKLLHKAGVPTDVLQLVPGDGGEIGARLVADPRIAGVVFTGSNETARIINQTLAQRPGPIIPLIAETGGQNCMIVDSSALLEQATDDIVRSAFGSAGQRCSALRVLYAQDDIADKLAGFIKGAMQELAVGDPSDFVTDIGPVIDREAQQKLEKHIEDMKQRCTFLASGRLERRHAEEGTFVAPHFFEIPSIKTLPGEVFGPVLHMVRFKGHELDKVIEEINGTGFGLTFGIQSRIEHMIDYIRERVHVGNIYINRNMIGATVGVQPFGGEGLSGTGPKAGGPLYLMRFLREETVTVNTAAIGGNLELLS